MNHIAPTEDSVTPSPVTAALSDHEPGPRAASSDSMEYSHWQEMTQPELDFLYRISRFYDSPRDLKRLVNTYRLLRSSLLPNQRDRFAGTENVSSRGYATVITELTILIVAPLAAPHFFRDLTQSQSNDLDQLVSQLGVVDNVVSASDRNLIDAILNEYRGYNGGPEVLDDLRAWSPITTRYSLNAGSDLRRRFH